MLIPRWEGHATLLATAASDMEVAQAVHDIIDGESIQQREGSFAVVLVGADMRASSERLSRAARAGVELTGVQAVTLGHCTTPLLHHRVRATNRQEPDSQEAYLDGLVEGFEYLLQGALPSVHRCVAGELFRCIGVILSGPRC